jgi:hypothetical protein
MIYVHDGNNYEVNEITGHNQTPAAQLSFLYQGGSDAHYSIDRMSTISGEVLFSCDDDFGRMVIHQGETYKVVSSSIILGAIANGGWLNMKQYLVGELINHFIGFDPPTSVAEAEKIKHSGSVFPNPFSSSTTIAFTLDKTTMVKVEIFNASGQSAKVLHKGFLPAGEHLIKLDANDETGMPLPGGTYYYMISDGASMSTGKIVLMR